MSDYLNIDVRLLLQRIYEIYKKDKDNSQLQCREYEKWVAYDKPVIFTVSDNCYLISKIRPIAYKFVLAEFLTFLSTENNRLEFIKKFYSNIDMLSTNLGNYGYRWNNFYNVSQFDLLLDLFYKDKYSRRGFIMTVNPLIDIHPTVKDVPCNAYQQFYIDKDNTLHLSNVVRSQDMIVGFFNDIIHFRMLLTIIYNSLKLKYPDLKLGNLYVIELRPHVYTIHMPIVKKLLSESFTFGKMYHPIMNMDLLTAREYANKVIRGEIKDVYLETKYADADNLPDKLVSQYYKSFHNNNFYTWNEEKY